MTKRKRTPKPKPRATTWRHGPPPSIGWYPASGGSMRDPKTLRWWDGTAWSYFALSDFTAQEAAWMARQKLPLPACLEIIEWTDPWW